MAVPRAWSLTTKKVVGVEETGCHQAAGCTTHAQILLKAISIQQSLKRCVADSLKIRLDMLGSHVDLYNIIMY